MTDPKKISIKDYTYDLPENRIANYPLEERDDSRLLIYNKENFTEDKFRNIAEHIPASSHFFLNDTKVVAARILFQKATGAVIEIFCLEPMNGSSTDITSAMAQTEKVKWQCLVGGASKWKPGQILEKRISIGNNEIILKAIYIKKLQPSFNIEFSWTPSYYSFAEILLMMGEVPLPPYIKRDAEKTDKERYQTLYARQEGSVAAPTAGLHFTQTIFEDLAVKNITREYITLHVGAGTFKPVKSETMQDHEMHGEFFEVTQSTIKHLIEYAGSNVIAVGTTTLRTIESLYWLGVQLSRQSAVDSQRSIEQDADRISHLDQWEAYELEKLKVPVKDALQGLLDFMQANNLEKFLGKTQLLITPGYEFKIVNGLVTNFHQPQSTLLLLVAAFIGDDWRRVYEYAIENNFRFLSYGDGCLLWKE